MTNLNISPDVTASDRNEFMKNNKSNEDETEKNFEKRESQVFFKKNTNSSNSNKFLYLLNQESNVGEKIHSKTVDCDKNINIIKEEKRIMGNNDNEMASIRVIDDKDVDQKDSSSSNNDPVLLEESIIEKKSLKKKKSSKKQKRSKSKKMYEAIEHNSILESITTHDNLNAKNDEIFGEKIESLYERLKKVSPFGNFNTFKLFKVIIKNGEDLRQEQFATQLINEFYQIFQLEEVDIWLKPYEILSTGHNVGLIECVPNSVSLDYLKRKSKNINSLSHFYETYFGPIDSESKNLI